MDDTPLFVQVVNTLGNLLDDVAGQLLAEIGKFDDLVK